MNHLIQIGTSEQAGESFDSDFEAYIANQFFYLLNFLKTQNWLNHCIKWFTVSKSSNQIVNHLIMVFVVQLWLYKCDPGPQNQS